MEALRLRMNGSFPVEGQRCVGDEGESGMG